ncbi:MAG TPA: hypothetical protein VI564_04370 [Candidatus Nanoarchaeia archaeon]|nr:hypothetical protein [Candidatus Nanoarchaeia archaeon]
MRNEHISQVERWADYVKNNPTQWKKQHTKFINAQFEKHRNFVKSILKQSNGFEKLVKIYKIKNIEEYRKSFGR